MQDVREAENQAHPAESPGEDTVILPLADYVCDVCGVILADQYFPSTVGAINAAPTCPTCWYTLPVIGTMSRVQMRWIPAARFDLRSDGSGGRDASLQKFTVHRQIPTKHGLVQRAETIDSMHTLRKIERESEQRYANGEGEPLRFRVYNQDHSNMDTNSFGREGAIHGRAYDSGKTPQKKENIATRRHGERKPTVSLGPGMRRAATPLKD